VAPRGRVLTRCICSMGPTGDRLCGCADQVRWPAISPKHISRLGVGTQDAVVIFADSDPGDGTLHSGGHAAMARSLTPKCVCDPVLGRPADPCGRGGSCSMRRLCCLWDPAVRWTLTVPREVNSPPPLPLHHSIKRPKTGWHRRPSRRTLGGSPGARSPFLARACDSARLCLRSRAAHSPGIAGAI